VSFGLFLGTYGPVNESTNSQAPRVGVMLINVGTPDSPLPKDVNRYLKEFLMDPDVIDLPWLFRSILVKGLIVPFRTKNVSQMYQGIWSERGSPLRWHLEDLVGKLTSDLDDSICIEIGMRYGLPSMEDALKRLLSQRVEHIFFIPLYPQYSQAATKSSLKKAKTLLAQYAPNLTYSFAPSFYDSEEFLHPIVTLAEPLMKSTAYDHVLFSFHGLPKRHLWKTPGCKNHCFKNDNCCDTITDTNKNCYRAQCVATARDISTRLNIPIEGSTVCFQSRLGKGWIEPFTDIKYKELAKQGHKHLLVFCPSFVTDCLETVDEVSKRGLDIFRKAGGDCITLVPSLNSSPAWAKGLANLIRRHTSPAFLTNASPATSVSPVLN